MCASWLSAVMRCGDDSTLSLFLPAAAFITAAKWRSSLMTPKMPFAGTGTMSVERRPRALPMSKMLEVCALLPVVVVMFGLATLNNCVPPSFPGPTFSVAAARNDLCEAGNPAPRMVHPIPHKGLERPCAFLPQAPRSEWREQSRDTDAPEKSETF